MLQLKWPPLPPHYLPHTPACPDPTHWDPCFPPPLPGGECLPTPTHHCTCPLGQTGHGQRDFCTPCCWPPPPVAFSPGPFPFHHLPLEHTFCLLPFVTPLCLPLCGRHARYLLSAPAHTATHRTCPALPAVTHLPACTQRKRPVPPDSGLHTPSGLLPRLVWFWTCAGPVLAPYNSLVVPTPCRTLRFLSFYRVVRRLYGRC